MTATYLLQFTLPQWDYLSALLNWAEAAGILAVQRITISPHTDFFFQVSKLLILPYSEHAVMVAYLCTYTAPSP